MKTRGRLRVVYFTLASVWGFMSGTVAVLGGLVALDRPLQLNAVTIAMLILAAGVALLGGFVAARAYQDAADRR